MDQHILFTQEEMLSLMEMEMDLPFWVRTKIAAGLKGNDERDEKILTLARDCYHSEGEIEIDDNACISEGEDAGGAYVMGWCWVEFDEADLNEEASS